MWEQDVTCSDMLLEILTHYYDSSLLDSHKRYLVSQPRSDQGFGARRPKRMAKESRIRDQTKKIDDSYMHYENHVASIHALTSHLLEYRSVSIRCKHRGAAYASESTRLPSSDSFRFKATVAPSDLSGIIAADL